MILYYDYDIRDAYNTYIEHMMAKRTVFYTTMKAWYTFKYGGSSQGE